MGKARFLIDKSELSKEIDALESSSSFTNQNELFEAVAKTPWAQAQKKSDGTTKPVTAAVVALRVKEFGLTLKTPKGRKGFTKGKVPKKGPEGRLERIKKKKGYIKSVNQLRYHFKSESDRKLINKVLDKGSLAAGVAAKCKECCCMVVAEARRCTVYACPLWPISPYTGGSSIEDEKSEENLD